jgi:hypothetical protein
VEEFHGQFKIGGEKKKGVLLDWRGNEKEEEVPKNCQPRKITPYHRIEIK